MKTIVYTSPFVPAEWIAAHGLLPSRIMLDSKTDCTAFGRCEGLCPYVYLFINYVLTKKPDGIVLTTTCDQMRRAFDVIRLKSRVPVFLMNVPRTWQNGSSRSLYLDELEHLGKFLVSLGGEIPPDGELKRIMLEFDYARKRILSSREKFSSRSFSESIAEFNEQGGCNIPACSIVGWRLTSAVPLAIVGGPLLQGDFEIFDDIEKAGGRIIFDATETGLRGFCRPFDRQNISDNPLAELADAYFYGIYDPFCRPNSRFYDWLTDMLAQSPVRGIILHRFVFCDIWHAELFQLKQKFALPVLDIDSNGFERNLSPPITARLCAFLEMLR
jgi:benzoyl-CoA reductase/2-hydroxyglutaryl-CoA dehydratase subunit BcrC/BadD/HgdB